MGFNYGSDPGGGPNWISEVTVIARPPASPPPSNASLNSFFWTAIFGENGSGENALGLFGAPDANYRLGAFVNDTWGTHKFTSAQSDFSESTTQNILNATNDVEYAVNRIDQFLATISDDAILSVRDQNGNYHNVSAGDFKAKWAETDFVISDYQYGGNRGGSNSTNAVTGRVTVTFDYRTIDNPDTGQGYSRLTDQGEPTGMTFIMLHEMGHASPDCVVADKTHWDDYVAEQRALELIPLPELYGSSAPTQQFIDNEIFANRYA